MHPTEQKVLQVFSKIPGRDIATSELVKLVFPNDYDELKAYIYNEYEDKETEKIGKRRKARLHRKILYHLNKLTEEGILKITRTEGKGEKFFMLTERSPITDKRKRKIDAVLQSASVLEDETNTLFGLESYEEQKIIKRFDHKNWISKINSFIIDSDTCKDLNDLYAKIVQTYPVFNDVVGIYDFQKIIDQQDLKDINPFIKKIDIDTKDYNKYINLLIEMNDVKDSVKLTDFVSSFSEINPDKIFIIFKTNQKSISNHTRFIKQLIKFFSDAKIRINIQNAEIKNAPMMIGRAGTYVYNEDDWQQYLKSYKGKIIGMCSSEASVYVDVYRFFNEKKAYSEFREFILKAAKALLLATTKQRRKSDAYFKILNDLNGNYQTKFFSSSQNYIRLWNYDVSSVEEKDDRFENFESVLKVSSEKLAEFCKAEETIFKSCGIPIRFKVVLSSAFKRFDKEFLSPRKYNKVTLKGIKDFEDSQLNEYLRKRERLVKIFEGGDRVRFFRSTNFTPEETLNEFNYILTHYAYPLFTYDFNARKGELTLDNFI